MKQNSLNPGFLDFYIGGPLVQIGRKEIMGHPQLFFQQDCRSFWQKIDFIFIEDYREKTIDVTWNSALNDFYDGIEWNEVATLSMVAYSDT